MSTTQTKTANEIGNFHSREGWYFARLADGSVRIQRTATPHTDAPVESEIVIPPNEWASILAHTSGGYASGDTGEGYQLAVEYHSGALLRNLREFAGMYFARYPDGSMRTLGRVLGSIPAASFGALYRLAKRRTSPESAFLDADAL